MDWIVIVVALIFVIGIGVGISRGAIKIVVSLVTTIVTLVLVVFLTPYAAKAITKFTPLDEMIKTQVMTSVTSSAKDLFTGSISDELAIDADAIKRALNAVGISEEKLAEHDLTIDDVISGKVTDDELNELGISDQVLAGIKDSQQKMITAIEESDIPKETQISAIEQAEIPDFFKELLRENNNEEGYKKVGATTFGEYVGNYLSKLLINVVAFIAVFILMTIIIRAFIFALDVVSNLPVIGALNRLGGGILGAVGALVIVWTIFMLIALFYTAGVGKDVYVTIHEHKWLRLIYDLNPIMKLATKV